MPIQQPLVEPSITSSSVSLYGLTVDMLDDWWPHVSEFIGRAVERSDRKYDLESVFRLISMGDMQLWVVMDGNTIKAAGTTQVQQYPCKKVCILTFLGGDDFSLWAHTLETLEKVASEWGCDSLEIHGRKGWKKILPEYQLTHVTLRKELWPDQTGK